MNSEVLRIAGRITLSREENHVCIECPTLAMAEGVFSVLKSGMELGVPVEIEWTGKVTKPRKVSDAALKRLVRQDTEKAVRNLKNQ